MRIFFLHAKHVTEVGTIFLDELEYNVPEYDADGNITGYFSEMMLPPHYREFLDIPLSDQELPEAILKDLVYVFLHRISTHSCLLKL
jgi:hypothetical protein